MWTVSKEMTDLIKIRISDHNPSMKATQSEFYFTFENFDIKFLKKEYDKLKKRENRTKK
jgi:hypothetical protein